MIVIDMYWVIVVYFGIGLILTPVNYILFKKAGSFYGLSDTLFWIFLMITVWPCCLYVSVFDYCNRRITDHLDVRVLRRLRQRAIVEVDVRKPSVQENLDALLQMDIARYNRDSGYAVRSFDERLALIRRTYILQEVMILRRQRHRRAHMAPIG